MTALRPAFAILLFASVALRAQQPVARPGLTPFASDSALRAYLTSVSEQACSPSQATRVTAAARHASDTTTIEVAGVVADGTGKAVVGAQVTVSEATSAVTTDASGRFTLRYPSSAPHTARVRARLIGYAPAAASVEVGPGDSVDARMVLCPQASAVEAITVTGLTAQTSVTNVQTAGVDEGDIVKAHGRFLIVLRRGRLFTVDVGGATPRRVSTVNAYGMGVDPRGGWYDEMLVSGSRVVVIGYSYARGGTEIGVFHLDEAGGLTWTGTWHLHSNDYYSTRNYASRLIGTRLIVYSPLYLWGVKDPLEALPGLRRWDPRAEGGRFTPIWNARRVFLPARPVSRGDVALHTVTTCDLASQDMTCEATVVVGPGSRSFYVSQTAVFVWMSAWSRRGADSGSVVVRIPFDGGAPTALGARGAPPDQFAFLESSDGYLNVLVRSGGWGDWMGAPEHSRGDADLLRAPLNRFGDGSFTAPESWYRPLPMYSLDPLTNRFIGDWLLYGRGSGWGPPHGGASDLFAVRWRDGALRVVELSHPVDRIEIMGRDAVVVGASAKDLAFSGIRLADQPRVVQRFELPGAAEGESRSHGFFYRNDGPEEGIIGLPVAEENRARWRQLFEGSASVFFLRNSGGRFTRLGRLKADTASARADACVASCVDWYGNARPLFVSGRVFALLGYELVEGRIAAGRLREVARLDFTPDQAMALDALPSGPRNPAAEGIWESLLHLYMSHTIRSEGDIALEANRVSGLGEQRRSALVVLMAQRAWNAPPYNRQWLDSLMARGLADAVCAAQDESGCRTNAMATFVGFRDPVLSGTDTATVTVYETAANPQHCSTGGYRSVTYRLTRTAGRWMLAGQTQGWAGTRICG